MSIPAALVDPGDREQRLEPDYGDPFEPGAKDELRAQRLEGRKLVTVNTVGSNIGETMYRIDRFRRFLPNRGSDSRGLIQFWGPRATRTYIVDDGPPDWTVREQRKLHTVMIGEIRKLSPLKRRVKLKRR